MRKLLIICLLFVGVYCDVEGKVQVCTYSNKGHPGLSRLSSSCKKCGINLRILGVGTADYKGRPLPYSCNFQKIDELYKYLVSGELSDDDIVCFVDAFDVFAIKGGKSIEERFLAFQAPIVFGAERICFFISDFAKFYPETDSSYKYINSGGIVGYVWALKEILPIVKTHRQKERPASDQIAYASYFLFDNAIGAVLDYKNALFLNTTRLVLEDLVVDKSKRSIVVKETGGSPCFIHGNGKGKDLGKTLYDCIYK